MGKASIRERQCVSIAEQIQARVGKKIGGQSLGQMGFEISNAGTALDDFDRNVRINYRKDAPVRAGVDLLQQWFGSRGAQVLLDFSLVLRDRQNHGMNLSRRAAKLTMRSRSQP